MTFPDSEVVTYTYDSRMLLDSLTGTSNYVTDTQYDSAGRITSRALGSGLTPAYTYYAWNAQVSSVGQGGRLQNLLTGTLQDLNYIYDAVGNVTEIRDDVASETNTYGYDTLDRLTGWTLGSQTENYTYDSGTGNLASKAGITYTYDTNHPHAVASLSNGNTYSQDANGNQTTRVIGSDTYVLSYDAENRLIEVKKNSATIATFAYDGDGKQVKSVVNSTTTYFAGMHYQVEGGTITKYYFAGANRVAFRAGSTLYYPLSDHLGFTSLTTNNSGGLISELRYKPWGETRYTSGTTATSYRFTGQREESSFGLYFYNARWYDSSLGRFAQADTIVPNAGNSQAWDRYAYSINNPIKYVDPSGHCWGVASGIRGIPGYGTMCSNLEQGWKIATNPNASDGQQLFASAYIGVVVGAHVQLAVGVFILGCVAGHVCEAAASVGTSDEPAGIPVNQRGDPYPQVIDPRTGEPIPYPQDAEWTLPEDRTLRDGDYRQNYIDEWRERGYPEPEGGWSEYVIHHIDPLAYGGDNSFENGAPVTKDDHELFNDFWRHMQYVR